MTDNFITLWMIIITILAAVPIVKSFITSRKKFEKGTAILQPMDSFLSITKISAELFTIVTKVLEEGIDLQEIKETKGNKSFYVELARRTKKIIKETNALSAFEKSFILTATLEHLASIIEEVLTTNSGTDQSVE